ncbi:unnamed protein product [Mytilus coruscus]|uniref:Uncharacterized protein n=1 Tax=Mytilus coruscus TaxID=42192 RepID=A0A6J8BAF1_MYTCO|nr:unnamed protein product [Mytilus coruscus]
MNGKAFVSDMLLLGMGRHSKVSLDAYRKKRKLRKIQKRKTLRKAQSNSLLSADQIETDSTPCTDQVKNPQINTCTDDQNNFCSNSESQSETAEDSSLQSDDRSRSPFSLSSTELAEVKNHTDKKNNKIQKSVSNPEDEPFMRDPLYVKWKEYQLLSYRMHKLKHSF